MSWFTALKSFVFGAPRIATDVFDKESGLLAKAGGFLNDLHYSDAEKARDTFAIGQAITEHVKATLNESTEKSRARRDIANIWIKVQIYLVLLTLICIPFNKVMAQDIYNLATCNVMLWGTGSVITFFFGGYVWGTYFKK